MLIFSVSFQFYRMSPKRRSGGRRWTYKPVYVMVAGRSGTNYRFVPWSLPPQAVATTRTPAWAGCLGAAQISFVPFPSWSWTSQAHARVFALTHIHWKFAGPDNVDCCCLHCTAHAADRIPCMNDDGSAAVVTKFICGLNRTRHKLIFRERAATHLQPKCTSSYFVTAN
jgi:hypothetical protein